MVILMAAAMASIFKRVRRLLRSAISNSDEKPGIDYQQAWDELNEFLETDKTQKPRPSDRSRQSAQSAQRLAEDYANLELSPYADIAAIRKNYMRLLAAYHPDKYIRNPDKQIIANEITVRLNKSYQRIMEDRQKKWDIKV